MLEPPDLPESTELLFSGVAFAMQALDRLAPWERSAEQALEIVQETILEAAVRRQATESTVAGALAQHRLLVDLTADFRRRADSELGR